MSILTFENQVHVYPDIYVAGYVERDTTHSGSYVIDLHTNDTNYYNTHGSFEHKFALKIVFEGSGESVNGSKIIEIDSNTIKGAYGTSISGTFAFDDEKKCRGDVKVKFYIKCGAMIEGATDNGGCNIGGEQPGATSWSKVEWKTKGNNPNMTAGTIKDPYVAPSNALLIITEITTRKITAEIEWVNGSTFNNGSMYRNTGYASINGNVQTFTNGKSRYWDPLKHNTAYTLKATVYDGRTSVPCTIKYRNTTYKTEIQNIDISDANTTVIVPSNKTTVHTKKLGCNAVLSKNNPTIAEASFIPTIAGEETKSANITCGGVKFYRKLNPTVNISTISCVYNGKDHGGSDACRAYVMTSLIPGDVYCIEYITTDAYNKVVSNLEIEIPYPLVRIFDYLKNKFKYAIPYIYHNGAWCKAYGYIFTNAWKMNSYKTITDARKENNS